MVKAKIAVTLDARLLKALDQLVTKGVARNRSQAVEVAVRDLVADKHRQQYLAALAMLDPEEEKAFAEEGMGGSGKWPDPY